MCIISQRPVRQTNLSGGVVTVSVAPQLRHLANSHTFTPVIRTFAAAVQEPHSVWIFSLSFFPTFADTRKDIKQETEEAEKKIFFFDFVSDYTVKFEFHYSSQTAFCVTIIELSAITSLRVRKSKN